jgi:hypothetical protein
VDLLVIAPGGAQVEVRARVVHLSAGSGIALAFEDSPAARAALQELCERAGEDTGGSAVRIHWGRPAEASADESAEEAAPAADAESATLYDQIRAMSSAEKMKLAIHGDRAARLILLKDTNKSIHTFVIQNPRITLDEVRYIAAYRQTNPEVLKMIGDNRDWSQNPGIVSALVGNPKTPPQTALKLLDRVPQSELRRLAKSESVPRAVQLAARKKVISP